MPFENLPAQGTLYVPNWSGISWSQPGGPNTTVYPQQQSASSPSFAPTVPGYPPWFEGGMLWPLGCGHWNDAMTIFRDYDNMLGTSVAIVCCSMCSFIQRYISPYEAIDNPNSYPVILP